MSTVHANGIDMKQSGIPMWRLVRAELRKLIDTRAGFWLLAVIGLVVLLVVVILGWTALAYDEPMSWGALLVATNLPMGLLLPIFGVMTVTSEWGQRTGLVTFTLEPRRVRTVIAKLLAGSLATLGAVLLSLAVTALVNVGLGSLSDNTVVWDVSARVVLMFALVHLSGFALGFGFGMVIPNIPTEVGS